MTVIDVNDVEYKVPMLIWFPLTDIVCDTVRVQGKRGVKVFPVTVTFDVKHQWILPIVNKISSLKGRDDGALYNLPRNQFRHYDENVTNNS